MNSDTAHELRTVNARVRKDGPGAWSIIRRSTITSRPERVLAVIKGKFGAYVATVYDDCETHTSPAYKRLDDAIDAAIAPEIAAIRGESWEFPSTDRYAWMDSD